MSASGTVKGYTAQAVDELPTLWDGFAKLVRPGLEVTAFGVNILDLPPDYETTTHDETQTGQEELYIALAGAGWVVVGGQPLALDQGHLVRVDPQVERSLASGRDGLRVLVVAGVPGAPYEPQEWSSTGD